MTETRSASQILFGHLPEQTVDVRRGVWRVVRWSTPRLQSQVDDATLRRELIRLSTEWSIAGTDGNLTQDLFGGAPIQVLSLDRKRGIELEPFPKVWICSNRACRRLHNSSDAVCQCGNRGRKGQLHFVGYCSACGNSREPWFPPCPTHRQCRITFPGTSSGAEILFSCPVCNAALRRGFGFPRCSCGGQISFNVHRAASVYTPRSVVIVNPPSHETMRQLQDAGGGPRATNWVVDGMRTRTMVEGRPDREALRRQLSGQGLSVEVVESMIRAAEVAGSFSEERPLDLPPSVVDDVEGQAMTIALATFASRMRVQDLLGRIDPTSELGILYRDRYSADMNAAHIERVEFVDRFPVLTGHFGYTRGDTTPGQSRLRAFREANGTYTVYGDIAETEALFFRLAPEHVARWLRDRGHTIEDWQDARTASISVLRASADPAVLYDVESLTHSYAHRMIRLAAVHAGIERSALSELLVPRHLSFFIYAAARGDFVLGGLQALFEGELHDLLTEFVRGEHRCALDPGCTRGGCACVACLHLGEPSCRWFNTKLDRRTLTGPSGLLWRAT
jgi:hypothetical protein